LATVLARVRGATATILGSSQPTDEIKIGSRQ
jgi:hypothetical protein